MHDGMAVSFRDGRNDEVHQPNTSLVAGARRCEERASGAGTAAHDPETRGMRGSRGSCGPQTA